MKRVVRAGTDFIDTAVSFLAGALRARLDGSERVSLALSGGSTPLPVVVARKIRTRPRSRRATRSRRSKETLARVAKRNRHNAGAVAADAADVAVIIASVTASDRTAQRTLRRRRPRAMARRQRRTLQVNRNCNLSGNLVVKRRKKRPSSQSLNRS